MEQPEEQRPTIVTLKALHENTSSIIETMNTTKQPVLVTRHGRVLGLLQPVNERELLQAALSELHIDDELTEVHDTAEVARALAAAVERGDLELPDVSNSRPLEEVLKDLEDDAR